MEQDIKWLQDLMLIRSSKTEQTCEAAIRGGDLAKAKKPANCEHQVHQSVTAAIPTQDCS